MRTSLTYTLPSPYFNSNFMKNILPLLLFIHCLTAVAADPRPQFQTQVQNPTGTVIDTRDRNWTLSSGTDSLSCVTTGGTNTANQGTANTVANGWPVKITDGTNVETVKPASTSSVTTDTALVVTERPDNVGTPTLTSVACGVTSTTLLAASTATQFLMIRNPTTALNTVWINVAGAAAVAAPPSIDLAPGSEADFFAEGAGFLPTAQINCIAGVSNTVTVMYK